MVREFLHEIGRKSLHLIILVVLVLFYSIEAGISEQAAFMFLVALFVVFLIMEYFRLDLNIKLPFFHKFIRPKEEYKVYGVIFFLSSTIIALAVFSKPVALAALMMTVFGDMIAAIVGKKYGTVLIFRNKTVTGFVTELITNLVIAISISLSFSINLYIPVTMAFVATITETATDEMEDNLMVPMISGFIGQILQISL